MNTITIPPTAVKVFKFVTEDYLSPGGYGILDYSAPYPKIITEPNCDPKEDGQCGKGIHVIPMTEKIDWTGVTISNKIIAGYVMPDDVIFGENNGKMRVKQLTVTHEPTREEIIPFILQNEEMTFQFAEIIDQTPKDDTRATAIRKAKTAFDYALYVDKQPRNETRRAVCQSPMMACKYAKSVDKKSRRDTRKAASKDGLSACMYAAKVDYAPTAATWKAIKGTAYEPFYLTYFATTAQQLDEIFPK